MALLVGRYVNKIDKKGRVSVPKSFRDAYKVRDTLKETGFSGLYAYPLFKVQAIEACDEAFMARLSESLEDLDMFSDDQDDLAAVILENAHALPFDPEGRVVLPAELLEFANISTQAVFVGRGGRMQIWNPDSYAKHNRQSFERARTRGATLQLRKKTGSGEEGA